MDGWMGGWVGGWVNGGPHLASLTSTFWQVKPRSVPTRSRNWMAASEEEQGCPELRQDLPPLSLLHPGDPEALQGSQAKERGDQRQQVMEVLGTSSGQEQGQKQLVTTPLGQGLGEHEKIRIEWGEFRGDSHP